ncbi:hypothetical protein PMAYCL1PPCAC_05133, partial [Pristionchus mayeri]
MPSGDFAEWREQLTDVTLHVAIENVSSGKIDLDLPKFKIESTTDGKATLQKLGVNSIFSESANLSGISEEGTEAAAATAMQIESECLVILPSLVFDRPFLYAIMKDDEVIFLGQ